MIKLFWAPMSKCFAALILSVALLGCGSKGSNSPATPSYPVTSSFALSPANWCLDYLGSPAIPTDQCITLYVQDVATKIYFYYQINTQIFRYCFEDSQGNYGLIQPDKVTECLNIQGLEDKARLYKSLH